MIALEKKEQNSRPSPKPFVKWAGGKGQLLLELLERAPKSFSRYFEPFLGGGAFFWALEPKVAYLSDSSAELINCYSVIKNNLEELIEDLGQHIYERSYYYKIRDLDRNENFSKLPPVHRASRFIYLNKTCFNGLYRVNSKGQFNVPLGKYSNPKILDKNNLYLCQKALEGIDLKAQSYSSIEKKVQKNDFVYLDPPYTPISKTANFTSYAKENFGLREQKELANFCKQLDQKSVSFMLTNSYTSFNLDLYKSFNIEVVKSSRNINSNASARSGCREIIVRNYKP